MFLAAPAAEPGTGTQLLGSIGLGGLALIGVTALILSTKQGSAHQASKAVALTIGLASGTVWIGAGQIWGLPGDLTLSALHAAGVDTGTGPFGDVGMGAIAICSVLVVYLLRLTPRTAGVLGVAMATIFATAGGGWSMLTKAIADFAMQFAGAS